MGWGFCCHARPARARSCPSSSPRGWQPLHQQQGSPGVAGLAQPHSSDTPGPRYRSIAQSYFRKAHGVLLLYDISSQSSFLNIRQWIEDIRVGEGSDRCLTGEGQEPWGFLMKGWAVPQTVLGEQE